MFVLLMWKWKQREKHIQQEEEKKENRNKKKSVIKNIASLKCMKDSKTFSVNFQSMIINPHQNRASYFSIGWCDYYARLLRGEKRNMTQMMMGSSWICCCRWFIRRHLFLCLNFFYITPFIFYGQQISALQLKLPLTLDWNWNFLCECLLFFSFWVSRMKNFVIFSFFDGAINIPILTYKYIFSFFQKIYHQKQHFGII